MPLDGDCHFANLRRFCDESFHALQCPLVSGVEMKIYDQSLPRHYQDFNVFKYFFFLDNLLRGN